MTNILCAPLFLLLIVMRVNGSTFADLHNKSKTQPNIPSTHSNDATTNLVIYSIFNVMSPDSFQVNFIVNNDKTILYSLRPEEMFTKEGTLGVPIHCTMYWREYVTNFYLYDPKVDGSHQTMFIHVAYDGVYHSWDNHNWNKRASWLHLDVFPSQLGY